MSESYAQKYDSINIGVIKGKIDDSVYRYMLTNATVAVYRSADSGLLQFTIPNNFGEFVVQKLPVEVSLNLVITHVGYKAFFRRFVIDGSKKSFDFGQLHMYQDTGQDGKTLEEVIVRAIAPMRMNGDTLEFNADAFKTLDSNATTEDLIRKLPGFTIWGDGEITFNGKKINAVLVDGKPFMGSSDITIATQNLPKNALSKVQVYQQLNEKNPLDSALFVNLKLKEDKKAGYFGKLGAGCGTSDRYTADGVMSGFSRKLQVSAAGAINNINKLAASTDVLIKNGSFKGEGTNLDYQSDFNTRGLNKPIAAGVKLQYDFIPDVGYRNSSRLNANYFINDNRTLINDNSIVNNFLNADTILSRRSISTNRNHSTNQNLSSRYYRSSKKMNLDLNVFLNSIVDKDISEGTAEQQKTGQGIISSSVSRNENENDQKAIGVGFNYDKLAGDWNKRFRIPGTFGIGYQFSAKRNIGNGKTYTEFTSTQNAAENRVFDRLYKDRDENGYLHNVTLSYPQLKRLIFNNMKLGGIEIGFSGKAAIRYNRNTDVVLDRDSMTGIYKLNGYLSNERNERTYDLQPAINISKIFYKDLTNRYSKMLALTASLRNQYFRMQHTAQQVIQNFSYQYSKFIPNAGIDYNNHQYGTYEARYRLNFSTEVGYPGVNEIAPLVDSATIWYRPVGNKFIKPQYIEELSFDYSYYSRKPKNPFNFEINAEIGKIQDKISDSTFYDEDGVRTVYAININGHKYVNGRINLKKYLEVRKNTTLEMNSEVNITMAQNPQYFDGILNISNNAFHNLAIGIGFRHGDLVTIKMEQQWGSYNSEQKGFDHNRFKSNSQFTRITGSLQLPVNLVWSSNITRNKSEGSNTKAEYFTIWNASLTYRFLKSNRGEAKFSALDILRQNKGVLNTSEGNTQIFTINNVLQQYFMLTLSFYPRKFGK